MGYISKEYVSKDVVTASLRKIRGWKYEDFLRAEREIINLPAADVVPREDYHTDHGYIWLCPECGLSVHSDDDGCPRCGHKKDETWRK